MVTLRLDPKLEAELKARARQLGVTKSELIRESIVQYMARADAPSAWEAGKDLFGQYGSGEGDLSENRKTKLKEKLEAKRGRRP